MKLEYQFWNTQERKPIEEYCKKHLSQKIHVTYLKPGAQNYWAVRFEIKGENKDNAKILSETNGDFINRFHPITLINESAEYYNKLLYPLVNRFERLLRKYLYVKAAISGNEELKKRIADLEEKDFGTINRILFVDEAFCKAVQDKIKKANTRAAMLAVFDEFQEKTLWEIMVNKDTLTIIRDNFYKMQSYRNDVMHAHNIDFETYNEANALFSEVNEQLQSEIDKAIRFETASSIPADFAPLLNTILAAQYAMENIGQNPLSREIENVAKAMSNAMPETAQEDISRVANAMQNFFSEAIQEVVSSAGKAIQIFGSMLADIPDFNWGNDIDE